MGQKSLLAREKVLETVKKLPAKFSIDQLIDEIILLQKIEIGLKQSDNDQVTPDGQLKKKLPKWLD